jgi:hypothetical protein
LNFSCKELNKAKFVNVKNAAASPKPMLDDVFEPPRPEISDLVLAKYMLKVQTGPFKMSQIKAAG